MATILITGANRGIGRELARQYAAEGHEIIRTMRGGHEPDDLPGTVLRLEVTDAQSVADMAAALKNRTIDLIINNAGVIGPDMARQTSLDMDFDGFLRTLEINTLGPLRVTQALLPNLRAAGNARIAVISSRMGQLDGTFGGPSGFVAYRASKTAVNKVFQCLAADLKGEGIAVAMLHPGYVRTDMGGPGADIDVADSAAGIRKVLAGLDLANTGCFVAYDGTPLAW